MALTECRECKGQVSTQARFCPHCGAPFPARPQWKGWGYEWKSPMSVMGIPLIHIAFGRGPNGRLRVAKGVIAIGQFGVGLITIAQFGVGLLFCLGQLALGFATIAQVGLGYAILAQIGVGYYVLAQAGFGKFIYTMHRTDPEALRFFRSIGRQFGLPI
jgi:hypothetical protein